MWLALLQYVANVKIGFVSSVHGTGTVVLVDAPVLFLMKVFWGLQYVMETVFIMVESFVSSIMIMRQTQFPDSCW